MTHIIVSGNEKGGSGKTTSAMHVIVGLLNMGCCVASIDLDYRQQSLASYIQNRGRFIESEKVKLLMPEYRVLERSNGANIDDCNKQDELNFQQLLEEFHGRCDFLVIDTPGSDTFLTRIAHSYADTVITPINDSFVDVDLLGKIDSNNFDVVKPGVYSTTVWEQKLQKASREKKQMDWVVMRNRLSATENINKRHVEEALTKLSKKFGFRVISGFGERVIFRELFLYGLTLSDARATPKIRLNASIVAARQELRDFISALKLPNLVV